MSPAAIAARLLIGGRVQGVSYRAWAVDTARGLVLSGWVRNRRDGRVELLAGGPADVLETFIGLCERGPSAARVSAVERQPGEAVIGSFEVRPTA